MRTLISFGGADWNVSGLLAGAAFVAMAAAGSAAHASVLDLDTGNGSNPYIVTADSLSADENTVLPAPAAVVTGFGNAWINDLGSEWIAPLADQSNSTRSGEKDVGGVTYQTTFDLPSSLTGASLSIVLAADDWVMISLNGGPAFYTGPSTGQWSLDTTIPISNTVDNELVAGANTLQFVVYNTGTGDDAGGGPTGLDAQVGVDYTTGTGPNGSTVPEPMTLSLFGFGLAGAAALRRRKKTPV